MKNIQIINDFKIPFTYKKLRLIFIFLILGIFSLGISESFQEGLIIWKIARNESGELAWRLLIFIIMLGLFSKIFPKTKVLQQLIPLRKEAGIMVFLIVLTHTIFHFLRAGVLGDFDAMYFQAIDRNWVILLGTIAFFIMLPLFLTSTNYACKKMGYKSWKFLQRFTHIAFILAAIHVSFIAFPSNGEIEKGPLIMLTIYTLGYLFLFFHKQKR